MHVLILILPMLLGSTLGAPAFSAPRAALAPTSHAGPPQFNEKTGSRVDQFRDLWAEREARNAPAPRPSVPKSKMDGLVSGAEARQAGKPAGKPGSRDMVGPNKKKERKKKVERREEPMGGFGNPSFVGQARPEGQCRGAVPKGVQGNNKYPNPQGFFEFSESVVGTKYNPEQLQAAVARLEGSVATVSEREKNKNEDDPAPVQYDDEFLAFAGLSREEVAPQAKDVFQEEAKKLGLDDLVKREEEEEKVEKPEVEIEAMAEEVRVKVAVCTKGDKDCDCVDGPVCTHAHMHTETTTPCMSCPSHTTSCQCTTTETCFKPTTKTTHEECTSYIPYPTTKTCYEESTETQTVHEECTSYIPYPTTETCCEESTETQTVHEECTSYIPYPTTETCYEECTSYIPYPTTETCYEESTETQTVHEECTSYIPYPTTKTCYEESTETQTIHEECTSYIPYPTTETCCEESTETQTVHEECTSYIPYPTTETCYEESTETQTVHEECTSYVPYPTTKTCYEESTCTSYVPCPTKKPHETYCEDCQHYSLCTPGSDCYNPRPTDVYCGYNMNGFQPGNPVTHSPKQTARADYPDEWNYFGDHQKLFSEGKEKTGCNDQNCEYCNVHLHEDNSPDSVSESQTVVVLIEDIRRFIIYYDIKTELCNPEWSYQQGPSKCMGKGLAPMFEMSSMTEQEETSVDVAFSFEQKLNEEPEMGADAKDMSAAHKRMAFDNLAAEVAGDVPWCEISDEQVLSVLKGML